MWGWWAERRFSAGTSILHQLGVVTAFVIKLFQQPTVWEQQYEETAEKAAITATLPSSDTEGQIPESEPDFQTLLV